MTRNNTVLHGAIIYSLFVGIIYCIFAIFGLLSRWCLFESPSSPFLYMLYMFYFRVESCEPKFQWKIFNIHNYVDVDMPFETQAVRRTYLFTITYLVLNTLLIGFAFLALFAVKFLTKRKIFAFFFIPLVIVLLVTIVFDVLATSYYVIDFVIVMKTDGLMRILEVSNQDITRANFELLSYTARYIPPIIMFLVTSKLFFFLICNIIWAVSIIHTCWSKYNEIDGEEVNDSKKNYNNAIMANDNPAFEDENDEKIPNNEKMPSMEVDEVLEDRYNDTSRVKDFVYPHQLYARSKKQKEIVDDESLDFKIQRPVLTTSYYRNSGLLHLNKYANGGSAVHDRDVENRSNLFQNSNGNLEYDEIIPDFEYKEMKIRPTPPPKPNRHEIHARPASSYYLNSTGHESSIVYRSNSAHDDSKADRASGNFRAPQELRSQLPWSYFNSSENVPRHAFMHMDDNNIPGMPLPDYDMSTPKINN